MNSNEVTAPIIDVVQQVPLWLWVLSGVAVLGLSAYRVYLIREEEALDIWYDRVLGKWVVRIEQWFETVSRWIEEFFGVD